MLPSPSFCLSLKAHVVVPSGRCTDLSSPPKVDQNYLMSRHLVEKNKVETQSQEPNEVRYRFPCEDLTPFFSSALSIVQSPQRFQ
jgi:hypothetical protein